MGSVCFFNCFNCGGNSSQSEEVLSIEKTQRSSDCCTSPFMSSFRHAVGKVRSGIGFTGDFLEAVGSVNEAVKICALDQNSSDYLRSESLAGMVSSAQDLVKVTDTLSLWASLLSGHMFWEEETDENGSVTLVNKMKQRGVLELVEQDNGEEGIFSPKPVLKTRSPLSIIGRVCRLVAKTASSISIMHNRKVCDLGNQAVLTGLKWTDFVGSMGGSGASFLEYAISLHSIRKDNVEKSGLQKVCAMRTAIWGMITDFLDMISLPFVFGIISLTNVVVLIIGVLIAALAGIMNLVRTIVEDLV